MIDYVINAIKDILCALIAIKFSKLNIVFTVLIYIFLHSSLYFISGFFNNAELFNSNNPTTLNNNIHFNIDSVEGTYTLTRKVKNNSYITSCIIQKESENQINIYINWQSHQEVFELIYNASTDIWKSEHLGKADLVYDKFSEKWNIIFNTTNNEIWTFSK